MGFVIDLWKYYVFQTNFILIPPTNLFKINKLLETTWWSNKEVVRFFNLKSWKSNTKYNTSTMVLFQCYSFENLLWTTESFSCFRPLFCITLGKKIKQMSWNYFDFNPLSYSHSSQLSWTYHQNCQSIWEAQFLLCQRWETPINSSKNWQILVVFKD